MSANETISPSSEPSYEFIFCAHIPENASRIAEALRHSDIIAIEEYGHPSQVERAEYAETLTRYVSTSVNMQEKEEVEIILAEKDSDGFLRHTLAYLAGTDKKIVLIDMNEDDDDYDKVEDADLTEQIAIDALYGAVPNDLFLKTMLKHLRARAIANIARERRMTQQLDELGSEYPGRTIGVIIGAAHTPVYHELSRTHTASRIFVGHDLEIGQKGAIARYDYTNELARQMRFGVPGKISNSLIRRMLLQTNRRFYGMKDSTTSIDAMSGGDVEEALNKFDKLKDNIRTHLGDGDD